MSNPELLHEISSLKQRIQELERAESMYKQVEELLRKCREQLACAIEGSDVGLWDWYVQTGETVFNERWAEIAGCTLAELSPVSIDTWINLCHPDDLKRSNELLGEHFSGRLPIYECEARIRHKDGHWVWILDRGKVTEWDGNGRPIRMTGTHLDITTRKHFEEQIVREYKRLQALLEKAPFGIMLVDENGTVSYVNPKFTNIFGFKLEDIPDGKTWFRKAYPDTKYRHKAIRTWIKDLKAFGTGEKTARTFTVTCKNGVQKIINFIPVVLESGEYLITLEDHTDLLEYQENLAYVAMHDTLTGLLNRFSLEEILNRSIARAKRGHISSLLYIDIDDFKTVNDTLGHNAGDEVLVILAGILKEVLRAEDIIFRLGGDEFAVLLEEINGKEALMAAERLRSSVDAYRLELDHRVFPLSISMGLMEIDGITGADELLSRADAAMYKAKEQGKNRVVLSQ